MFLPAMLTNKPLRVLLPGLIALLAGIAPISRVALADPPEEVNLRRTIVVDVAERTKNAVVYISSTKIVTQRVFDDPIFQQINVGWFVRQVPVGSLGSGFI